MLIIDFVRFLTLMQFGLSTSELAASMNVSKPVILEIRAFLAKSNVTLEQAMSLGNGKLNEMYRSKPPPSHKAGYLPPDLEHVHKELAQKGVTLERLWAEYKSTAFQQGLSHYCYSSFCSFYRDYADKKHLVMRITHKPGDAIEVDWSGLKPSYYDEAFRAYREAHVFLAALPYSLDFFFDIFTDEKIDSWITAHIHAFDYFGGVPRLIKPDNLKTGVTKHVRLERALNPAYKELCNYYGIAIVPARNKKPKDKSHAEGAVGIVERDVIAPLRGKKFDSLDSLKKAMQEMKKEVMDRVVPVLGCTRSEYYLKEEKPFMRPLPKEPYERITWSTQKVPNDYVVKAGLNRYSVPYKLYGETVHVRQTSTTVEVFYNLEKVATHAFIKELQRFPIILEEHMPRNHREYLHYTREDFLVFADSVGPATRSVFQTMMDRSMAPEQVYPDCASFKHLADRYGNERLESACKAVLESGKIEVKLIDKYVKQPETLPKALTASTEEVGTIHHNVQGITRGAGQFQNTEK